jgi:uncharacterized protein YkwD
MMSTIKPSAARLVLSLSAALLAVQGCASSSTSTVQQQGVPRSAPRAMTENYFAMLERDVVQELNRVRTNPARYADVLEKDLQYYRGDIFRRPEDDSGLQTREGAAAVREAIGVLRSTKPVGALRPSSGMSHAARDHLNDQAPRGLMNHKGTDGSMAWDRVARYGQWQRKVSENMTFGPASPHDIVAALLIDDGITNRGHRKNVLDPDIKLVGIACGPHKTYRVMCDIVHAGGFTEQ